MPDREKPKKSAREAVRERSRAAYQELILEAAERVFAAKGFAGARVVDVAKEAGVATGTLYNYFDGKAELFQSLMELRSREITDCLNEIYEREKDPIERVASLVRFVLGYLDEHVAAYAVFVELGGNSEENLGLLGGDKVVAQYAEYVHVFERAIRSAVRAKRMVPGLGRSADLAAMLTGSMNGLARAWIASGHAGSLAARSDTVVRVFLCGVTK